MKSNLIQFVCILVLAGVAGYVAMNAKSTPAPAASAPAAVPGTGSLKGFAKYDGDPPAPRMIDTGGRAVREVRGEDGKYLGMNAPPVPDEGLVVDPKTKGIQWVIVRIMNATPKDVPPKPATAPTINQGGFRYTPHVLVVAPNTEIEILNPDKVLNNFHTSPFESVNPFLNFAIKPDQTNFKCRPEWLKYPDLIQFKSDIFNWMQGYIVCHDPRYYAVTGADGTFEIKDLPPGKYTVNVWHENFGNYMRKKTIDVEIKAGVATDLGELKFAPRK